MNIYVMQTWVWKWMLFHHFDWDLTHQILFLYILPSCHMNLRDQPWRCTYLNHKLNWTISAFVSFRLAQKSHTNSLFPSGKAMLFLSDPWRFGLFSKFQHNIKIMLCKYSKFQHNIKISVAPWCSGYHCCTTSFN